MSGIRRSPLSLVRRVWTAFDGLAADTLWGGSFDLFMLLTTMLTFLLLQKVISLEQYGSYVALYAIVGPIGSIVWAGPGLALLQRRLHDGSEVNTTVASFLSLTLFLGSILGFLAIGYASVIIDDLSTLTISLIVASELLGMSVISIVGMSVQSTSGYPAFIRVKFGAMLIKFSVIVGLAGIDSTIAADGGRLKPSIPFIEKTEALTIQNLGIAYAILYSAYALWLVFIHLPRHNQKYRLTLPHRSDWKASAAFGMPMSVASMQENGDKVVLKQFGYDTDAGLYGAAYRLVLLGTMPLRVLDEAAFRRFLPDDPTLPGLHLRRARNYSAFKFGVSIVVAGLIIAALPIFEALLLDDEFKEASKMLPWLTLFIPLIALSGAPMNGLLGLGRSVERAYVFIGSGLFSIVLYLIFIPPFGWRGAVGATVLSELFLAIASWVAIIHYQRKADRERPPVEAEPTGETDGALPTA